MIDWMNVWMIDGLIDGLNEWSNNFIDNVNWLLVVLKLLVADWLDLLINYAN